MWYIKMIVCFVLLMFLLQVDTKAAKLKVKLMTVIKCKLPDAKWSPDRTVGARFTITKLDRDTTVLSSNFTLHKRQGPIVMTYRSYQLKQNAERNLVFKLEKVACTNPMTFKMVQLLQVQLTKECYLLPGNYGFQNLNLDKLSWILTKTATVPGKYIYQIEFNDPKGLLACYDFICELLYK